MPCLFELTPPSRRSSNEKVQNYIGRIKDILGGINSLDGFNIPEVIDENHNGKPLWRNLDIRLFGLELRKALKKDIFINKVVVHEPHFLSWLKETKQKFGMTKLVLAGGTTHFFKYPGPDVWEANRLALQEGFTVGNISIPTRQKEEERMLKKTKSGATFFTTQVLFEDAAIKYLLKAYQDLCRLEGVDPATVYLSFAPVSERDDITFLKWLGVVLPPHVEEILLQEKNLGQASIAHTQILYQDILQFCKKQDVHIPLGINIEQISAHNLSFAAQMMKSLAPPV